MKAVVVHGPNDLRVDERPDPAPGAGEVLIAMEWGGVCGSDLAYWRHGSSGTAVLRAPLVLGHQVAGRIAAIGDGVTGIEVGLPVTVHPAELVGDGCLPERIAGRTNLYPRIRYFGSAAFDPHTDGGFSELRVARADQIRPLPETVSTEHGALAEPLAVALHAVHRAGDLRGRDVVVNGAGPSDRWSSPQPSTAAQPPSSPPTSATPRSRSRRPSAPTRSATWPQATPCPRTPSCCSRRRAPRPHWGRCCVRPPAEARSSRWATCPAPPCQRCSATS